MSEPTRVLVVDSDMDRLRARVGQLRLDGLATDGAHSLSRARALAARADVMLVAELEGGPSTALQLVREVRNGQIDPAVSAMATITFADDESHLMSCFRAGADMTLPSTASTVLVSASVEALQRRGAGYPGAGEVRLGKLKLDTRGHTASVNGADVALSPRQFDLLEALAQTPGKVYSRDELYREVWGAPDILGSRALDTQLNRLSHRLADAGATQVIKNVRGRGFRLCTDGAER
jgi:two-component system response regulator AdeR